MMDDSNMRGDLVDKGIFVTGGGGNRAAAARRPWMMATGEDLVAPTPSQTDALYDVRGNATGDEAKAAAKASDRDGTPYYFVKVGTFGAVQGHLLDPKGVYYDEADLLRDVRATGRAKYEYKGVDGVTFAAYIDYLKSRKAGLLRQAERGISG